MSKNIYSGYFRSTVASSDDSQKVQGFATDFINDETNKFGLLQRRPLQYGQRLYAVSFGAWNGLSAGMESRERIMVWEVV